MAMISSTDSPTAPLFSFNDSGLLVDSTGARVPLSFRPDRPFTTWLESHIASHLLSSGFERRHVPTASSAPVYCTNRALQSPSDLLLLICSTGRVAPGLWSPALCATHGLAAGSALPCLAEARHRGFEVLILNPNAESNCALPNKYGVQYGPANHLLYVIDELLIANNDPRRVFVIAHSMGGACTSLAIEKFPEWAMAKIAAIAYTNGFPEGIADQTLKKWAIDHSVNWVQSTEPGNTRLKDGYVERRRSAGTNEHALTTAAAMPFIWEWFDEVRSRDC